MVRGIDQDPHGWLLHYSWVSWKIPSTIKMSQSASAYSLLLFGLLVSGCSAPQVSKENVRFSFALAKAKVVLHEPLYLKLAVANRLGEKVTFDLGANRKANLQLVISGIGDSTVSASHPMEGGLLRLSGVSLEPGETYTQDVLVNEWYQFSKPGPYRIEAKLVNLALKTASGTLLSDQTRSTPMPLEIAPPDPARLAGICQSLLQTALISPSPVQQGEAAFALSYVQDAIAIPYLAPLARDKRPYLRECGLLGLARIADGEGLEKVIAKLGTKDPQLEEGIRARSKCARIGCPAED
jgi:hypothetical protein